MFVLSRFVFALTLGLVCDLVVGSGGVLCLILVRQSGSW